MVHILKYLLFMTKVPLGNLIKILAPYFNYLYGQKCIRVLGSEQSFGKKISISSSANKGKIFRRERRRISYSTNACHICLFCTNIGKLNHNGFGYMICFEKNGHIRTIDFTKICTGVSNVD